MAELFKFKATDKTVKLYLNSVEIREVTTWQVSSEYDFEFHQLHTTGYPIYVRISGNKDTQSIPKIDTKNKNPSHYHIKKTGLVGLDALANGGKLKTGLTVAAQNEIISIITNSWEALSLIASGRWGDRVRTPEPKAVKTQKCKLTKQCSGVVEVTTGEKKPCSKCGKLQQ